jgi:LCP family protein required for cell wall assembly
MLINGTERYDKTNHAYSWAGPAKVMEVLSNNYKIEIDHYVSIDFASFEKVIDLLGGVTVPITESEARYMNRTTRVKGFEAGDSVLLNGKRALIYSRIRKLDSEIERTRRQRNVIASVVKGIKASSISEINELVETFLPYVTTNYRYSEILSLATTALTDRWMNYQLVGMVEPNDEFRVGVSGFRTYTGYLDVWIADYVKAAQEVQLALYDTTNIQVSPDHISTLSLVRGSRINDYGGESENTTQYDYNNFGDDETDTTSYTRGLFDWRPGTTQSSEDGESTSRVSITDFFTRRTEPESSEPAPEDEEIPGSYEEPDTEIEVPTTYFTDEPYQQ